MRKRGLLMFKKALIVGVMLSSLFLVAQPKTLRAASEVEFFNIFTEPRIEFGAHIVAQGTKGAFLSTIWSPPVLDCEQKDCIIGVAIQIIDIRTGQTIIPATTIDNTNQGAVVQDDLLLVTFENGTGVDLTLLNDSQVEVGVTMGLFLVDLNGNPINTSAVKGVRVIATLQTGGNLDFSVLEVRDALFD
jgi:hypothetical protein